MNKVTVLSCWLLLIPGIAQAEPPATQPVPPPVLRETEPVRIVAALTPAAKALEKAGLKSDNASLLAYLAQESDPTNPQMKKVAELVRQLGDTSWEVREDATKQLKAMGSVARDALEKAATDTDPEVTTRVKDILEHLEGPSRMSLVLQTMIERKTPGAVRILLERLPGMDAPVQEVGRQALAACAGPEDVPILRQTLKNDHLEPELRAAILTTLFETSLEADPVLLKSCLADPSKVIRRAGLYALYKAPALNESFVPPLVKLLADEDIDLAGRAAGFLAKIGDPASAEPLLAVLHRSKDYSFRHSVIDALIQVKGRGMAGPLAELLSEPDFNSRTTVLGALGRIFAPQAAEAVIGVLGDSNNQVRSQACLLLATYADARAVEPLCRIVTSDKDPGVRRAAAYALGRIGDTKAVDSLIELVTTDNYPAGASSTLAPRTGNNGSPITPEDDAALYKREARETALISLCVIGGPKAVEALFRATGPSQAPTVRGKALELLAEMGDPRAADLVIEGLSNSDSFIASSAVRACAFVDDPRLLPALIKLVNSNRNAHIPVVAHGLGGGFSSSGFNDETAMREQAMKLLKDRWPKEARPVLLERLKDSEGFIAGRAAEWLAEAHDRTAIPELITLLEKGGRSYAPAAAATALCKLKVKAAFEPSLELLEPWQDDALAAALGDLAAEGFVDELEAELRNPKGHRAAALNVAAHVPRPELADVILPLLDDHVPYVHDAVLRALGELKNPHAVAPLVQRLKGILAVGPSGNGQAAGAARRSYDPGIPIRPLAIALGKLGDKSAVEPLLQALVRLQNDQQTTVCIARALGRLGEWARSGKRRVF